MSPLSPRANSLSPASRSIGITKPRLLPYNNPSPRPERLVLKDFPLKNRAVFLTPKSVLVKTYDTFKDLRLTGKDTLPVQAFRERIVEMVKGSRVCGLVGETGSGKSTEVPQYLIDEAGFDYVIVMEPRRVAATNLANYVASKRGEQVGETVGFAHSRHQESSDKTKILYCTDGYYLSKILGEIKQSRTGQLKHRPAKICVIGDEYHEQKADTEIATAFLTELMVAGKEKTGLDLKYMFMSATMDSERISEHFAKHLKTAVPVMTVPGRGHTITDIEAPNTNLERSQLWFQQTMKAHTAGHNVLTFVPGKADIAKLAASLKEAGVDAEIIPLHGQLSPEEQAKAFANYPRRTIIIATSMAKSSLTIPVSAVVDSGLTKEMFLENGIECLREVPISQAEADQRRGRAGRIEDGYYLYLGPPFGRLCPYSTPEIQVVSLNQNFLRMKSTGRELERLPLVNLPPPELLNYARASLEITGCINKDGDITRVGKAASALPVSPRVGVMLVEAARQDKKFPGVLQDMAAIAAIFESEGILDFDNKRWKEFAERRYTSDLFVHLAAFRRAKELSPTERKNNGIRENNFFNAQEQEATICSRMKISPSTEKFAILRMDHMDALQYCICKGMVDRIYSQKGEKYQGPGGERILSQNSILRSEQIITGHAITIELRKADGTVIDLPLITSATILHKKFLGKHAPRDADQEPISTRGFKGPLMSLERHTRRNKGRKLRPRTSSRSR